MAFERHYMERAIELAKKGIGAVNPNPLVGAVIVKNGRIIGEGYHERYGELHAERNAIAHLTEDAAGAELYVTLEPCCHFGKQPPCTLAIVEAGISTVYVGSDDPNEKVAGKGVAYLRAHGVDVKCRMMKEECDALNPVFFHYITKKTPYVVMKYAMTLDGKIAAYTGASQWISGEEARFNVQQTRNYLTGIMVGIQTIIMDDPSLTCRLPEGRNPIRIICDSHLKIPVNAQVVETAFDVPTIVAALEEELIEPEMLESYREKRKQLGELGVTVLSCKAEEGRICLSDLMKQLAERGVDGILLEGGGTLNYGAVKAGIVQEVQLYLAPKILGGREAKTPVEGEGFAHPDLAAKFELKDIRHFGEDVLLVYKKRAGTQFDELDMSGQ